jgi:hypothetical protein
LAELTVGIEYNHMDVYRDMTVHYQEQYGFIGLWGYDIVAIFRWATLSQLAG